MKHAARAAVIAALLLVPNAMAQTAPEAQAPSSAAASEPAQAATPEAPPTAAVTAAPHVETPQAQTPTPTPAAAADAPADEAQARARAQAFFDSLHRQTGIITVAGGKVQLNVPADAYYYLSPEESRRVLVELWGNPPDSAQNIEGMLFPRDGNPAAGSWGAVLEYSADGYVSDSDASTTNYDELLTNMQQQAEQTNAQRHQQGFPRVTLVGWAERPHYDAGSHKIFWGRQIHFEDINDVDTLNYDIRVLGREGYLVVSFVASMPELASIRQSTPAVLAMADFTPGNRYADYREGVDQRAAYGLGGLIAGGVVIAAAQKTGLLALLLLLGKKFIVLIGVALVAIGNFFRRMFTGRAKEPENPAT